MRLSGLLTRAQVETIHQKALRVLSEHGVQVEHEGLRDRLTALGSRSDADRVCFPESMVEALIQAAPKSKRRADQPTVSMGVGVYQSQYLDPTNQLMPFDEARLAKYFGLAESLGIESRGMLGLPFVPEGIPAEYLPLAEKLYAWRYGASPGGSVIFTGLCEPLLEMFEIHARATNKSLEEAFSACGFMISPLRLTRPECEQLLFFAERGLRMGIGHLPSQGGSAPVTFAGTLALSLAEQMFMFLLQRSLWEDAGFGVGGMVTTMDMRTGVSCYGRPERHKVNLAFADIADFYGCSCWGHTGCTDAHLPSTEAGVQKATGALVTALATGHAYIEAGLLGIDEICSPVQMALDHDLVNSLQALFAEVKEEYALEEILAHDSHLGTDFTVEHFRDSLFQPITWSGQLLGGWTSSGMQTDIDKARDFIADFERSFTPAGRITDDEERELRAVIDRSSASG